MKKKITSNSKLLLFCSHLVTSLHTSQSWSSPSPTQHSFLAKAPHTACLTPKATWGPLQGKAPLPGGIGRLTPHSGWDSRALRPAHTLPRWDVDLSAEDTEIPPTLDGFVLLNTSHSCLLFSSLDLEYQELMTRVSRV